MRQVPPVWLSIIAWLSLGTAFVVAFAIGWDIGVVGNRQSMRVMEFVWPVTALYMGPAALFSYLRWGRLNSARFKRLTGRRPEYAESVSVGIAVSHCGAGCTIGDVAGEWIVFGLALRFAGVTLLAEYAFDFALAFGLGIAFQYFSIAPARGLGLREGLVAAVKADALSLACFEIGLFGWMALSFFVLFPGPHLEPDRASYWLMMQVGMLVGFATAYPANVWLVRRGVKEAM